jgi:C4-dicarboxylate transporter
LGIVISAIITFWVGYLIYKKYKPQPVLFMGGIIMMYIAAMLGYSQILGAKATTGSVIFDAFEFFDDIAIMRGKREDDFAPVKNKEGADSPKTAKELYEKYWEKHGKK